MFQSITNAAGFWNPWYHLCHKQTGWSATQWPRIPVMRLLGSKTSIFSSKSTAPGDILGNPTEKLCFGYWGSCRTYLRALSLRKNPRLESSGEPRSCSTHNNNNYDRFWKRYSLSISHKIVYIKLLRNSLFPFVVQRIRQVQALCAICQQEK